MTNSILYLFLNLFNECKRLIYIFIFITVLILSLAYYMFYNKNIEITSEMEVYPITKIDTLYLDKYLLDLNNFFFQSTNADILLKGNNILKDFHPDTIIELVWQNLRGVNIKQVINQSGLLQKYSNKVQDQYLSLIVNSFVANSVAISHDKKQYNIIIKSYNEGDTKIILDAIFKEAENLSKIQINEIFYFYTDFLNDKLEEEIQIAQNKINITKILEKTINNNLVFEQKENKENFNLNLDGQDHIFLNHNTSLANTLGLRVNLKGEMQEKLGEVPNYLSDLIKGSIVLENELNIIKNKKNKTGMLLKSLNIDQINNKIQSMRMISYSVNSISAIYAYNKNVVMIISFFISVMTYVLICLISLAYREKI